MRKGAIAKKILLATAGEGSAGWTVPALSSPVLTAGMKPFASWYYSQDRRGRYRIRKTFKQLRRERLIDIQEKDEGTKIVLTENGRKRMFKYQLEELKIEKPRKWDKKWRLVIFDIPEKFKNAREALRGKLNELEFLQIQKSVWVCPYECRNEIDFIAEIFEISPYVRLIEANKIDGEELLRRQFDL